MASHGEGQILKRRALYAGEQVFAEVDPGLEVTWTHKDGDFVVKGTIFGSVRGSARSILVAERIALNFLQRMSGIATATHAMAAAVKVCNCFPEWLPCGSPIISGNWCE